MVGPRLSQTAATLAAGAVADASVAVAPVAVAVAVAVAVVAAGSRHPGPLPPPRTGLRTGSVQKKRTQDRPLSSLEQSVDTRQARCQILSSRY